MQIKFNSGVYISIKPITLSRQTTLYIPLCLSLEKKKIAKRATFLGYKKIP